MVFFIISWKKLGVRLILGLCIKFECWYKLIRQTFISLTSAKSCPEWQNLSSYVLLVFVNSLFSIILLGYYLPKQCCHNLGKNRYRKNIYLLMKIYQGPALWYYGQCYNNRISLIPYASTVTSLNNRY